MIEFCCTVYTYMYLCHLKSNVYYISKIEQLGNRFKINNRLSLNQFLYSEMIYMRTHSIIHCMLIYKNEIKV